MSGAVHSVSTARSALMRAVRQHGTEPELVVRAILSKSRLRFKNNERSLPGSPDLVNRSLRIAIFVHGCYWHFHGCSRSTVPKSRRAFWTDKFNVNRSRDERNVSLLLESGWRVLTVWECALRGKAARPSSAIAEAVKGWLQSSKHVGEIAGIGVPRRRS